jgi:hypothetical protein
LYNFVSHPNGKAQPQRRVCEVTVLNKSTVKPKSRDATSADRRCRLQRVCAIRSLETVLIVRGMSGKDRAVIDCQEP